jgi:hypothetical protein
VSDALRLELASAPLEAVPAELAVVAFFSDERPLRGGAGRADWRLCGALSRWVQRGVLHGAAGEAALAPSGGGIAAPRVMALGLGRRVTFDAEGVAAFAREALRRARALRASNLALGWPERIRLPAAEQVAALLAGLAAAEGEPAGPERVWLCAAAVDTAALAEAFRGRGEPLPDGIELALPAPPQAPRAPSSGGIPGSSPGTARLRVK